MEEEFGFKAASIAGDDNIITIFITQDRDCPDIEGNNRNAVLLAEQLARWLTPATTRKLREELSRMGY